MLDRRRLLARSSAIAAAAALPLFAPAAQAQNRKDSVTLAMVLEPPGLDPTAGAASAISEVVLYNVFETLTKINPDSSTTPLLAQSWQVSEDRKTWTFALRQGVQFHNGAPFTAETVKFSFDRAAADGSTNKDKRFFANLQTRVLDAHTVQITTGTFEPNFLFYLGQGTAIMVEPQSAPGNATAPVGTGPYRLGRWNKGASVALDAWPQHRDAAKIALRRATFRFIPDQAAQVAALLAGDVDVFPRVTARSVAQFQGDARFQVLVGDTLSKVILAMNHARQPLQDVRVRRAIAAAIDRQAVIAAAAEGYGQPIGSYYVPAAPGYVDTTAVNPYNVEKAKALLLEVGIKTPLELVMPLPPTPYARQGGEFIAAQLEKVGIRAKLQNVEWAQWLSGTFTNKNYDLTLIAHVEPFDLDNFTKPDYYWGYQSAQFNALFAQIQQAAHEAERARLLGAAQRFLADECVHAFLYAPQFVTVARKNLRGLWHNMPLLVNDLTALAWA